MYSDLRAFMVERNTKLEIDEQINQSNFILANSWDDIWFWEADLVNYFYGELLEQIFNFYSGLRLLHSEVIFYGITCSMNY